MSVVMRPVRVSFSITFSIEMSEPSVMRAATITKAAELGSPGTSMVWALSSRWPVIAIWRPSSLVSLAMSAPKAFNMRSV